MGSAARWLLASVTAVALAAPATSKEREYDPEEMICERQPVLGSRLAKKKVCMTRAQWDEKRRDDRDTVDKQQLGAPLRCVPPQVCG
jgi:hypothetical protein